MLIRTQDKTALVILGSVAEIAIMPRHEDNVQEIYAWFSLQNLVNNINAELLGSYSTKEKAVKVLDMLEEEYLFCSQGYEDAPKVFQMPQDDEVEE